MTTDATVALAKLLKAPKKKPKITSSSGKAKGRALQKHVRDSVLKFFPQLEPDDVKSTSMGVAGEDVQLSPAARKVLPVSFECKSRAVIAAYGWYEQAEKNAGTTQPVLVVKQNRKKPLAVIDFDYYMMLVKDRK